MLRRTLTVLAWGLAGMALASVLVAGSLAVAGTRLTEPASPIRVFVPGLAPEPKSSGDAEAPATSQSPTPGGSVRGGGGGASPTGTDDGDGDRGTREPLGDD
jgi:hypothetical protein